MLLRWENWRRDVRQCAACRLPRAVLARAVGRGLLGLSAAGASRGDLSMPRELGYSIEEAVCTLCTSSHSLHRVRPCGGPTARYLLGVVELVR